MQESDLPDWHVGTSYRYNLSPNSTLAIKERFAVMCVRRQHDHTFVFSELDMFNRLNVRSVWTTLCVDCVSAEQAFGQWQYRHEVQEEIKWQMSPHHPSNRSALDVPASPTDSPKA